MKAIVETGGKQYYVKNGDVLSVEKLECEVGAKVVLDKVLFASDDQESAVGTPYVADAKVTTTVLENGKGAKVVVFKYKAKKDERKKNGHRQPYTLLKVESISFGGKTEKAEEKKAAAPKKAAPKKTAEAAEAAPKAEKKPAAKKATATETAEKKPATKKAAPKKAAEETK